MEYVVLLKGSLVEFTMIKDLFNRFAF